MKKLIEKGLFLFGIYMIFTAYLFFASDRIEKLEKEEKKKAKKEAKEQKKLLDRDEF